MANRRDRSQRADPTVGWRATDPFGGPADTILDNRLRPVDHGCRGAGDSNDDCHWVPVRSLATRSYLSGSIDWTANHPNRLRLFDHGTQLSAADAVRARS